MKNQQRRWVASLLIAFVWGLGLSAAQADESFDGGRDIRVEAVTATSAKQGESSQIRLRIVNDGHRAIHVMGLDTPLAPRSKLVARIGRIKTTVFKSMTVPPGEMLDLTTSHLWYEIERIAHDLHAGDDFLGTLKFVDGQLPITVHVHAS